MKALEESEFIMQELKDEKRQRYTYTDSLFKALDKWHTSIKLIIQVI